MPGTTNVQSTNVQSTNEANMQSTGEANIQPTNEAELSSEEWTTASEGIGGEEELPSTSS